MEDTVALKVTRKNLQCLAEAFANDAPDEFKHIHRAEVVAHFKMHIEDAWFYVRIQGCCASITGFEKRTRKKDASTCRPAPLKQDGQTHAILSRHDLRCTHLVLKPGA